MKKQDSISSNLTWLVVFALVVAPIFQASTTTAHGFGNHLDHSFDDNGVVESLGGTSSPDVAIQSDDKIVIASSSQGRFFLTRRNANGTLDTTFAGDGTVSIDFGNDSARANALVIQSDGKIVVVGNTGGDYAIARVGPSGVLDLGFSGDGRATFDFQGGVDSARAVAITPDGKIVVAGHIDGALGWGVLRLNANGSPDITFSGDGKVLTDIGGQETATGVAVRFDGKIVVTGSTRLYGNDDNDFALVRYNTNGTLDTTFGGDGRITTDFDGLNNSAFAMKSTPAGTMVIVGHSDGGGTTSPRITVARYSSSGQLDTSFNGIGWAFFDLNPARHEYANDLILSSNGDITLTGNILNYILPDDLFVLRVRSDGRRDPKFGTGGLVITVFGTEFDLAGYGIAAQQSGKLVVVGTAFNNPTSITSTFVARYSLDGAAVPGDMTGDGQADYALFRPSTGTHWILNSATDDDFAHQFGLSGDVPVPGDYDRDGKTDVAVFRAGTWYILRSSDLSYYSVAFGLSGDKAAQGDYDGDGYCDTAVFRPSDSTWYIQYTASGTTTSTQFGTAEDKPVQADYDGDGITDLATFRPSDGVWYIQRSKFGYTTQQFGSFTDRLLPGDYDGDGRADVGYYRPETGAWVSINSQTNTQSSVVFGSGNAVPAPGDFDGDGKTDPTFFRPSSGWWYVKKSGGGYNIEQFGTSGDIPLYAGYSAQ